MLEDRLSNRFIDMGFRRINSNAEGIYLFYQIINGEAYIISIIHTPHGNELTQMQYEHILKQMKDSFLRGGNLNVHLLGLIFTRNPEKAKILCDVGGVSHWIIDLIKNRLIIYETQLADFLGIRDEIENLLMNERLSECHNRVNENTNQESSEWNHMQAERKIKNRWFSPINTIIIGINIIVFILMQFTNVYGGTDGITIKGALSWIFLKKDREYYRLLTSMFMHADWSHLLNNMLVLFIVGDNLERAVGRFRYLFIYFGSGVIAGITSISYNMVMDNIVYSIGVRAIFGIVGAMLYSHC